MNRIRAQHFSVVWASTFFWIAVAMQLYSQFTYGQALVIAVWIAVGSPYLVRSFSDFQRAMRPIVFLCLAIIAPAWPLIYANARRNGTLVEDDE